MKKFAKKFSFIVLASALAAGTLVGCGSETGDTTTPETSQSQTNDGEEVTQPQGTIVIAQQEFNGVFSEFFYTSAYDGYVTDQVDASLLKFNPQGEVVGNLANYEIEEVKEGDTTVQTIYTLSLQEGLVFSDGEPITADDIIFTMNVYCDPTYDGMGTFGSLNIVGLDEYRDGDATSIAGIEKVDDLTVKLTINGIDPAAITKLVMGVSPEHYYGVGFEKGSLDSIKALNGAPMGAGPYKFVEYENNVISFEANENYFLGVPKTEKIKFQVVDTANLLEAVKMETVDISNPSASPEMVQMSDDAGLHHEVIDNAGYGYIGMNKERIPDDNVRKGLMHLMNRAPAIQAYYGDLAQVIERPMTTVSWAYPQDAEEYYGYSPEKALEYFTAAGYENVDGKLMKDGEQLRIEVGISGISDHPTGPVLTQMKADMEKMGAVLEIIDSDVTVLFDRLNAYEWDMWVAAWGNSLDPDLFQIYHTDGGSARHKINNPELDKLIMDARSTTDVEVRKDIYAEALDLIMDEAVIMPIYQRTNMHVFNPAYVDITTLPEGMTPYFSYAEDLHNIGAMVQ